MSEMELPARFDYDDTVRVVVVAPAEFHPGETASVIAIFRDRPEGKYFESFPPGIVYSVEFEGGVAIEIHEQFLEGVEE